VGLVESGDFACATSANSLKIIHGGLRYLQRLDLRQMREAVRERSTWLRIAPHLIEPLPILIPAYRHGLQRLSLLRAALAASDLVTWDRNRDVLPEHRLPPSRIVSRGECLDLVPELDTPELTGGVLFYDAQMYNSERLVLEVVQAAEAAGAVVANYTELEHLLPGQTPLATAVVRDAISGERFEAHARVIVNATGHSLPALAERLVGRPLSAPYSLAINVLVPSRGHQVAFAVAGRVRDPDAKVSLGKRQFFFVPWRGRLMIGTGHWPYRGDLKAFTLEGGKLSEFLAEVNACWPGGPFDLHEVVLVHSGLVPVARHGEGNKVHFLRRAQILDHSADGGSRIISVSTPKYTTARRVAERAVDLVCKKLARPEARCRTSFTPLPGAPNGSLQRLVSAARERYEGTVAEDVLEHLVRTYGRRYEHVLAYRDSLHDWDRRILAAEPVIKAQWAYAAREEMAQCPEDLIHRRTELGARGLDSEQLRQLAAQVMNLRQ
jgi:glycerol-3-phosphate dehydrogenase